MKRGFYPKLALTGFVKNKTLYVPYLITCSGMTMMYYLIAFLSANEIVGSMKGGTNMQVFLGFGQRIIAFFACLFLFYTNSFLIRRRRKEFGLYNILGMDKRSLARILIRETLLLLSASLIAGLACGILFSKLAELCVARVLYSEPSKTFLVHPGSLLKTILLMSGIFLLLLIHSLHRIHVSNPVELLAGEQTGEKPPRGNRVLALLGLIGLGIAYYLAVTITQPLETLSSFFTAVLLVIASTYLLMIAGSVALCRLLQKNKRYYYRTGHFISVSSMAYRMKRNGAGLASICILATMVLVMVSSTSSLYLGIDDVIKRRYPKDISIQLHSSDPDYLDDIHWAVDESLSDCGLFASDSIEYGYRTIDGYRTDDRISINPTEVSDEADENRRVLFFLTARDYTRITGNPCDLQSNEILLYDEAESPCSDRLAFGDSSLTVKNRPDSFPRLNPNASLLYPYLYLVVSDETVIHSFLDTADGFPKSMDHVYSFNLTGSPDQQVQYWELLAGRIAQIEEKYPEITGFAWTVCAAYEMQDFYYTFGGLLCLGIFLGIVFLFATVLMIYYKQISEGYEDRKRFEILQKVGMTGKEIKKSINSQVLTVFFLPLLAAGMHIAFAFPMIRRLLMLMGFDNVRLYLTATGITYLVFALFYALVYHITSRSYYRIVSR